MEMVQKAGTIIFILILLSLFVFFMVRNAWLSDDAFITFRTVDNFVNGYGLTWNTDERVQAYTHPLWMFLVSLVYACTREIYFTLIILSCVVSFLAVALYAFGIGVTWQKTFVGIAVLCLSKAFMDYTTSGLENPLTFLLCAAFFVIYYRMKKKPLTLFLLSLCASLCALNRLDTILFFLPVLAWEYFTTKKWAKGTAAVALGFLPLLYWTGFSLFYYGFPFPNTFYAKLNTGIDQLSLLRQGLTYYLDTVKTDPLTLPLIVMGIFSYFFTRDKRTIPASAGILLYCAYILKIGGGFMSGRFFAVPLFCSVLILSYAPVKSFRIVWAPALCLLLITGLSTPLSPVFSDETYEHQVIPENGIADERGFYYQRTGFLHAIKKEKEIPRHFWIEEGKELRQKGPSVVVRGYVGMMGFFAGPQVHFIDFHALTDPLLSRLHIKNPDSWRIGHFNRTIPPGYRETIETGKNLISDEHLARYYDALSFVVKGNLFAPGRLKEIWRLNTGKYDHLLCGYRNEKINLSLKDLSKPGETPGTWDKEETYLFSSKGIRIHLGRKYNAARLEMTLAPASSYTITYYKGWIKGKSQVIYPSAFVPGNPPQPGNLSAIQVDIPLETIKRGFTTLDIVPVKEDGMYSIGYVSLKG